MELPFRYWNAARSAVPSGDIAISVGKPSPESFDFTVISSFLPSLSKKTISVDFDSSTSAVTTPLFETIAFIIGSSVSMLAAFPSLV